MFVISLFRGCARGKKIAVPGPVTEEACHLAEEPCQLAEEPCQRPCARIK
jgi:hypothetical protein